MTPLVGLWLAACAALGLFAWRGLFVSETPTPDLSAEVQGWLMLPADTSPAVVLGLAAWLLLRRSRRLRALPPVGGAPWLTAVLLVGGLGAFAWGTYTSASDLLVFALMLTLFGLGNLFGGRAALRALALPVGFLIFAVPIPGALLNAVVFRFQLWTAELTGLLLYAIGLPALVTGDQIFREGDTFTIIEGCSGMRSVETLTMLAVLMVDLFRRHGWHAALLIVVAPPLAFLLNAVRALFLMLNPLSETIAIHNAQGIAILLTGVLLLFFLDGALARLLKEPAHAVSPEASSEARGWLSAPRAAAATAALAGVAALSAWLPVWDPGTAGVPRLQPRIPRAVAGWSGTELETDYRVFLGRVLFAQQLERRYIRGREVVDLFVAVSDRGARLGAPHTPKTLYPGSGWVVEESGTTRVEALGRDVDYRVIRSGLERLLLYHWREGTNGLVGESFRSLFALDRGPLRPAPAVVVRMTTRIGPLTDDNREAAAARLASFSGAISPSLAPLGGTGKDFPDFPELGKAFPRSTGVEVSKSE